MRLVTTWVICALAFNWLALGAQIADAKTLAVIVGVRQKDNALSFTISDAHLMRQTLSGGDEDVALLTSDSLEPNRLPTKANITRAVLEMAAKCQPDDAFLFYFSGHGYQSDDFSYLAPHDENGFLASFLSVSELRTLLANREKCRAKVKLLILDACHSGATKAIRPLPWENLVGPAKGIMTFAACRVNETSLEVPKLKHGVFTYFLVRGLAGSANPAGGPVTLRQLREYVETSVAQFQRQIRHPIEKSQHPYFILPPEAESATLTTPNPTLQAALPDPAQVADPQETLVVSREPLKPGLIVLMEGELGANVANNELRKLFISQRFPVVTSEKAEEFVRVLQTPDSAAAADAIVRLSSRFLVRGSVTTTVRRLSRELGRATSVQVTIDAQLLDSEGNVLAEATSDDADGSPVVAAGATEQSASNSAVRQASQRVFKSLLPHIKEALARDHA